MPFKNHLLWFFGVNDISLLEGGSLSDLYIWIHYPPNLTSITYLPEMVKGEKKQTTRRQWLDAGLTVDLIRWQVVEVRQGWWAEPQGG